MTPDPATASVAAQIASMVILGFGAFTFVVTFYRVLVVLEQEFGDDEAMIKDPLSAILDPTTTFETFRANGWSGFEALWAAQRFRAFYRRYRPLLDYSHAFTSLLSMLCAVIVVVFVSYVQNLGPLVHGGIGTVVGFVSASYLSLIERGKSLKKVAIKLKK